MRFPKPPVFPLFACLCLLAVTAGAQQLRPVAKTLLWRISGKGLSRPSYLYGTIHLSDKRLFNFDEHLYKAIEETEGFAMELNPDEMVGYFINNAFEDGDDEGMAGSPRLRDVLRDEEYRRYSPALSRRLNKPAGNITTRDIVREKNRWVTDYASKGSMPTFVDAYLYNLARRQGKWVGGIEDMADQIGLIEGVDRSDIRELSSGEEGSSFTLTDMITAYLAQDIGRIDEMVNGLGEGYRDALLLRRNVKMARRMDSLMAFRPMLFAVGAAHLPGDSGVISLLRKRGFTVEPVYQGRKIAAADYVIKEVEIPWYPVKDKSELYTVSMPGNPVNVKMSGLLDMQFFFDLFNMRGYMTTAIAGPRTFRNPDSTADEMAKNMFPGQRLRPQEVITGDGLRGREYISHRGGQHMQLRIFAKDNVMFIVAAIAMKRESLNSPDIPRYFSSFRATNANTRAPRAQIFADSTAGIRFTTPALMDRNKKLEASSASEGWWLRAWSGQDVATGAYIMLVVKNVEPGKVISNDTVLLEESYNRLRSKNKRHFSKQKISLDGYSALRIEGRDKDIRYTALTYVRGGQHVMLMVVSDSLQSRAPGLQTVFNTVRLLPFASSNWRQHSSTEGRFSGYAPSPWKAVPSGDESNQSSGHFNSYDSASSVTYSVLTDTISSYVFYKNDSSFWAEQMRVEKEAGDSVVYLRPVRSEAETGYETLVQQGGSNTFMRVRKFLHGNVLYSIYAQADRTVLFTGNAEKLFNSVKADYIAKPINLSTNKTALLLNDLAGRDSAKALQAYYSLMSFDFTKADLPQLRSALFRNYDTAFFGEAAANNMIGRRIAGLLTDGPTLQFLRESYPRQTGKAEAQKMTVLNILAAAKTQESYQTLVSLWASQPPRAGDSYTLYNSLIDSLPLLQAVYPSLLRLAGDTLYGPMVAALGVTLIDSGRATPASFSEKESDFQRSGAFLAKKSEDSTADYYYLYAAGVMDLLGTFNTPASDAVVQKFYRSANWDLRLLAVGLLAKRGRLDTAVVAKLAAKKEWRLSVYKTLREAGQEQAFPARYKTQQAFASAAVYEAADDGEEMDISVRSLVTTVAEYKGEKRRFYLYEVIYGEGEEAKSWLGIAGPYDVAGKELLPEEDLTEVLTDDEWTPDNGVDYNKLFRDWLRRQDGGVSLNKLAE